MAKLNINVKLKVTYRWWFWPVIYFYAGWCKFWFVVPDISNKQFLKAGITITPEVIK